jgi:hypothetical protein
MERMYDGKPFDLLPDADMQWGIKLTTRDTRCEFVDLAGDGFRQFSLIMLV